MPEITTDDGCRLRYRLDGAGEGAPVLLLSNSLGTTLDMWAPQVPAFAERHRVLRYDTRGHGGSGAPAGPATIDRLGRDALALADALGIERFAFCGLSLGGMIGQWLGSNAGPRVTRLVLANTSAFIGGREVWNERIAAVAREGMGAVVPGIIDRWFTKPFQAADPAAVERIAGMLRACDPAGYAACAAAVRDMDQRAELGRITAPTLLVAGRHDQSTTPEQARLIADAVPGARVVELDAAHLSNVEQAQAFTREVGAFLAGS